MLAFSFHAKKAPAAAPRHVATCSRAFCRSIAKKYEVATLHLRRLEVATKSATVTSPCNCSLIVFVDMRFPMEKCDTSQFLSARFSNYKKQARSSSKRTSSWLKHWKIFKTVLAGWRLKTGLLRWGRHVKDVRARGRCENQRVHCASAWLGCNVL